MGGRKSIPLGACECPVASDLEIACLNPETVRPDFQIEVSPYVSPLRIVLLICATVLASAMAIGGSVLFILGLAGKI